MSGRGTIVDTGTRGAFRSHGLEAKGVFAGRNHRQRYWRTTAAAVHVLGFKPGAQTRVINLRLTLPEVGGQSTLDPKVIQLKFNCRDIFGEIATDIICADV